MSLGIIIKAPEGIVLAAESRVTLTAQTITGPNPVAQQPAHPKPPIVQNITVNFDNANKLLTFNKPYDKYGAVTYGAGAIGNRTAQSLIPEFETTVQADNNLTVFQFAEKLSQFFLNQWNQAQMAVGIVGQDMIFNVAGFDDNEPYGRVYQFQIPNARNPAEQNASLANGQHQFGITVGGQGEIVSRLLMGYDPNLFNILVGAKLITPQQSAAAQQLLQPLRLQTPIQFMPLQDCVNLAVLLIKTTIEAQSLTVGLRGCGGPIDVAIITKGQELRFIKQKNVIVN